MRAICLIALAAFVSTPIRAQNKDTVRNRVDYRQSGLKTEEVSRYSPSRSFNHYWSVQANQLLSQLLNFQNDDDADDGISAVNPFTFNYAFNSLEKGTGLTFGLGYRTGKVEDIDQGSKRETKRSDINFRMGFEKKSNIGKRWILGTGIDVLLNRAKDNTKSDFIDIKNTTNGWGIGPRASVLFSLTDRFYLGTEMSWYYLKAKTETEFPANVGVSSDLTNSSFNLQVPVAIFLHLRF